MLTNMNLTFFFFVSPPFRRGPRWQPWPWPPILAPLPPPSHKQARDEGQREKEGESRKIERGGWNNIGKIDISYSC